MLVWVGGSKRRSSSSVLILAGHLKSRPHLKRDDCRAHQRLLLSPPYVLAPHHIDYCALKQGKLLASKEIINNGLLMRILKHTQETLLVMIKF